RFFAALAQSIAMVFTGLMARELGGRRWAQIVAALAAAVSPMAVCMGTMLQYIALDYLWWVLAAYGVIRLLRSDNPRWWVLIGGALGLGMMTKYTMIFFIAGIVAGVLLTPARRYLKSVWLWMGAALSLLIFLPNLLWQIQHDFISLTFLKHIHTRDVEIGRTGGFFVQQLFVSANLFTLPLWVAGLWFYFVLPAGPVERDSVEREEERRRQTPHQPPGSTESRPTSGSDRRYRALGWMFLVPLLLFFLARGRFYYMAPAYPMLFAAGATLWEKWLAGRRPAAARVGHGATWTALGGGAAFSAVTMMPIAPINSVGWRLTSKIHDNFTEQIGWPELAATVAEIYQALPPTERAKTAILADNYGEAGALNLYGRARGLPEVISGINSYWWRGYGATPASTVILVGFSRASAEKFAREVTLAGQIRNRHGVRNEETRDHPDIFLCRGLRRPWPEFWKTFQDFG
ncbi:MAG: glycosyltransferase family 39 protein, partial [Chthoniobacterales bacterium]